MHRGRGAASARSVADATREKLIEAAGRVFAERGFHGTTVREICLRAGANVAAVNYHFGDKLGLYAEILRRLVRASASDVEMVLARDERGLTPEERLRRIIAARVRGVLRANRPDWASLLMTHEFARPSPAMARVVNEAIRPIYDAVREIAGEILGLPRDHETTRMCVHSIIAQVIHYVQARPILAQLWPELRMTPEQIDRIANHVAEFSLAYLRAFRPPAGALAARKNTRRRT